MAIKIPNLGDGIDSAVVLSINVKIGDSVKNEQTVLELETDKAVAPVPSTVSGKITNILVKEGDTVKVGQLVMETDAVSSGVQDQNKTSNQASSGSSTPPATVVSPVQMATPMVLPQGTGSLSLVRNENVVTSPTITKIARWLGLDLGLVSGTGAGGRIEIQDLQAYIKTLQAMAYHQSSTSKEANEAVSQLKPLGIDFSKWGSIKEEKVTNLRKKIGQNLKNTWNTVPHVTQFDEVDVTVLMDLRKKYKESYAKKGASLTLTGVFLSVLAKMLLQFPMFNSSYDEAEGTLIYKEYVHLGVAVDTENGLIVPVLRNADKKSIFDLSVEISELAEKARNRTLSRDDMQGGTFTVSNLGGLGVGAFTPIVNFPEVAILGLSRSKLRAVWINNQFEARNMMPISLSYDHRVIDGADCARFVKAYIKALESFDEKDLKLKGVK